MSKLLREKVLGVHHWTDTLFTFSTTRSPGFRFKNGHFTMIGLEQDSGRPLLRAYSIASSNYEESLSFFSIKVPDGPLTSQLQYLKPGDDILIRSKTSGTLIADELLPGKRLYLLSTGTGLAPFMSIIKDPEIYDMYDNVILTHGTRWIRELAYQDLIMNQLPKDEYLGELVSEKLLYYPTVTREKYQNNGRLTDLITSGQLTRTLNLPELDPEHDRFMICGSPSMLSETCGILDSMGFKAASEEDFGHYVVERAFTEQ
jgi:ferredoxin--NADP+ reductase